MPIFSLILFLLMFVLLMVMIQIQVFKIGFAKLGLTPETTLLILLGTLLGSGINLSIFKLKTQESGHLVMMPNRKSIWASFQSAGAGSTVIAINVGGCIIPLGLCLYFVSLQILEPLKLGLALLGALI